jgi:plasmid maintenance system antidote protein VapI
MSDRMQNTTAALARPGEAEVVGKGVLRAAARLGLTNRALASVLGVSEATLSRLGAGTYQLEPGQKAFELAVLFIRLYRSLDAIVGGDEGSARAWLHAQNDGLGAAPITLIHSVTGLVNVVAYLDARRALA